MKKKVLIIDNEEDLLTLLQMRLTHAGHDVAVEATGKGGLLKAKTFSPDIIFVDIVMPDIEGPELVRLFQEDAVLKTIPIVFMSGIITNEKGAGPSSIKVGSVTYSALGKPFDYKDLLREIGYASKRS